MANIYLRWKNPASGVQNTEWEEMSGQDFFSFLNSPESEGRYFIKLDNDICPEADVIFIESSKEQYDDWFRDYNHHRYLRKAELKRTIVSLDYIPEGDTEVSLYEMTPDERCPDVEEYAIHSAMLRLLPAVMDGLSERLRDTLVLKYFQYPDKTDEEIARIIGITKGAFRQNKLRALKELKKFFEK